MNIMSRRTLLAGATLALGLHAGPGAAIGLQTDPGLMVAQKSKEVVEPPVSAKPLKPGHEYLVVVNRPNNLQFVDLKTDEVFKTCALPDRFGLGTVVVSPDRSRVYVLGNGVRAIYGINVDSCKTEFKARLALAGEDASTLAALSVSRDGKEVYTIANPMRRLIDRYEVGDPRLQVYKADAGLEAKPVRTFPMPRQIAMMATSDDGSVYLVGPDIYKVDVHTGARTVVIESRNWKRDLYAAPDVLYIWPYEASNRDFTILYTAPKFADNKKDMATAEYKYGYFNINLKTGKTETTDFATLTEVYFTGVRSPKDPNIIYGVLNRLAKYDIKEQKLLKAEELNHSYYTLAFNGAGSKLYLGGTLNEIGVHDPESLEHIRSIKLPGGDMSLATMQVFVR